MFVYQDYKHFILIIYMSYSRVENQPNSSKKIFFNFTNSDDDDYMY